MIRKAIIVALALGAVAVGVVIATSYMDRETYFYSYPQQDVDHWGWEVEFRHSRGRMSAAAIFGWLNSGEIRYLPPAHAMTKSYRNWWVLEFGTVCLSGAKLGRELEALGLPTTWIRRERFLWTRLWFPFILFATYPTIAFIRGPMRRRRRRKRGQCLGCGYSLEGNVTGVCPECGVKA